MNLYLKMLSPFTELLLRTSSKSSIELSLIQRAFCYEDLKRIIILPQESGGHRSNCNKMQQSIC